MDRRFTNQRSTKSAAHEISDSQNLWCTGKDSNLRTSLGGTDLQSVGFNHSPTCAKILGRCGCRSIRQTTKRSTSYNFTFATQGNQGSRKTPRRSLIIRISDQEITARRKSTEWSALEKPVAPLPSPLSAGNPFLLCRFLVVVSWSWRRESNPRPSDYKSDALPTELRQQIREKTCLRPNLSL